MGRGDARTYHLRVRVKEFGIPPIHDALVVGKRAPIGCVAIRKALDLLAANTFQHFEVHDDVVSDVLVRAAIMRRIPEDELVSFILHDVKPMMAPEEVLHLDLDVEVTLPERTLRASWQCPSSMRPRSWGTSTCATRPRDTASPPRINAWP